MSLFLFCFVICYYVLFCFGAFSEENTKRGERLCFVLKTCFAQNEAKTKNTVLVEPWWTGTFIDYGNSSASSTSSSSAGSSTDPVQGDTGSSANVWPFETPQQLHEFLEEVYRPWGVDYSGSSYQ